ALRVLGQHALEVAGPQAGLVASGAGTHLDDHVLVVIGIAFHHGEPDLVLQRGQALLRARQELAQLGVVAVLADQLARARAVAAGRRTDLKRSVRSCTSSSRSTGSSRSRGSSRNTKDSALPKRARSSSECWLTGTMAF